MTSRDPPQVAAGDEQPAASPFVIITPAHNEEAFIELTIRSVLAQTVRPSRWIVVDDNSTDRTAEIVASHASAHPFITLVRVQRSGTRHFGNKVNAFNRGVSELAGFDPRYIGNLDADISLEPGYFAALLARFEAEPRLGLAGGMVSTCMGDRFVSQEVAHDSVAGAVQLFRRACFDQVGGYLALPQGGIDAAAEITARTRGWHVRTFPELRVLEHRRTGTATARPLSAKLRDGRRYQSLGYSLPFLLLRCLYRAWERPRVAGSLATLAGYLHSRLRRDPVVLPRDVVHYLRAEQYGKLLRPWRRGVAPAPISRA